MRCRNLFLLIGWCFALTVYSATALFAAAGQESKSKYDKFDIKRARIDLSDTSPATHQTLKNNSIMVSPERVIAGEVAEIEYFSKWWNDSRFTMSRATTKVSGFTIHHQYSSQFANNSVALMMLYRDGFTENVVLPQAGVYTGTVVKNGRVVLKYRLTVYEADHPDQLASVEKIWPQEMAKYDELLHSFMLLCNIPPATVGITDRQFTIFPGNFSEETQALLKNVRRGAAVDHHSAACKNMALAFAEYGGKRAVDPLLKALAEKTSRYRATPVDFSHQDNPKGKRWTANYHNTRHGILAALGKTGDPRAERRSSPTRIPFIKT